MMFCYNPAFKLFACSHNLPCASLFLLTFIGAIYETLGSMNNKPGTNLIFR